MNRCQNTSSKFILHGENTLCLLNPLHCCLTQIRKIQIIDAEKFYIFDVKTTILKQFRQIQSILTFFHFLVKTVQSTLGQLITRTFLSKKLIFGASTFLQKSGNRSSKFEHFSRISQNHSFQILEKCSIFELLLPDFYKKVEAPKMSFFDKKVRDITWPSVDCTVLTKK